MYFISKIIWLGDNKAKRNIDTRHTGLFLVLGCIWLFVLHTRFNRACRSVFRFVSDNVSDKLCIVCTQTALLIKKQKALGDFQIISHNFCVLCTGPKPDICVLPANNSRIHTSTYSSRLDCVLVAVFAAATSRYLFHRTMKYSACFGPIWIEYSSYATSTHLLFASLTHTPSPLLHLFPRVKGVVFHRLETGQKNKEKMRTRHQIN